MRRIAILASNSFSGADFADFALDKNCQILGISRSQEPHSIFLPYKNNPNIGNFYFQQADLNTDFKKILSLIFDFKPEVIVDYAGQGMVAPSWVTPEEWYQTNIVSKVKLHNEVRKNLPRLECYLRFSTPEVYGNTSGTIDETAPLNPSTPYAVSHAAQDMSLKAFYNQYNFPVVFTRAANVYGAHQQLYRIIPRTFIYAMLRKKLKLDGGGKSIRNFVHIRDVSSALWNIIEKPRYGEVFHISSQEYVSIRELVERVCKKMNISFSDFVEVTDDRPGKDNAYFISTEKMRATYNWDSKTSLNSGLEEVFNWVTKNLNIIKELPLDYVHKP